MLDHSHDSWREGLNRLRAVLQFLDEIGAPDDVRAHVDLAICRFEDQMDRPSSDALPDQLAKLLRAF
ncbi:hypothetical protein [Altericroceibacterium xinjiangense]|uniref:hypothetical protein n=1 Tax=Altericroceibacterium xinjiangense TaxID=762261 RepID=UPI000F7D8E9F|nr:hypothetical protein [Altericroceibacterium xinjiangense]